MEIETLIVKFITVLMIGTLLIVNHCLMFIWIFDLIHFFNQDIHYCSVSVYVTGINMGFSALFLKKRKQLINIRNYMINEPKNRKTHTHLLFNMSMIQLASGFIDSTIYRSVNEKYELSGNSHQLSDFYHIVHLMFHKINIVSVYAYFWVFIMIIGSFFFTFVILLIDHIEDPKYQTIDRDKNLLQRIKCIANDVILSMDQIVTNNF